MKKYPKIIGRICFLMILTGIIFNSSCNKDDEDPSFILRVGLIVDEAGIDDRTFNQSTYEGILLAQQETNFDFDYESGMEPGEYAGIIEGFIAEGKNLIVGPGYKLADAFVEAAQNYPEVYFLLLDFAPEEIPSNMACVVFNSDEASFLCGFLAAFWAYHKDPGQPQAGWISGPPIEAIQTITEGYVLGMDYFNENYALNVDYNGNTLSSFTDSTGAAGFAQDMIGEGVDVIFSFAGAGGNGALAKTRELGKWAIGMDSDQYVSFPEVRDILLTSCMKNLGNITYQQLINFSTDNFTGGIIIYGNLENQGVDLAPYHEYENLIPDSIKAQIEVLKSGINDGTIITTE